MIRRDGGGGRMWDECRGEGSDDEWETLGGV